MRAQASIKIVSGIVVVLLVFLIVFTLKEGPNLTGYVSSDVSEEVKACYLSTESGLIPMSDLADCCTSLKNAVGCQKYVSDELADDLYKCKSKRIIVANKALIDFCMG
ncbi:hypothetical protein ACFLZ7_02420 [Nanoarchaeota archaeon]